MAIPSIKHLELNDLVALRRQIDGVLATKRSEIEAQIARMFPDEAVKPGRRGALKGMKVAPKYRSKKDKSLTWSGRGALPRWMRAEMKGTKLKKEAFLILRP